MGVRIFKDKKIVMTLYIVRAKPENDLSELRKELESGNILKLRPFGKTLHNSLKDARIDTKTGYAFWVEEDYCSPPLAMGRESVLDRYFADITVAPDISLQNRPLFRYCPQLS
jgi:hypothetical protein